ncbi:hypothetical protein ACLI4Z_05765 [Natrialbaceae archaeon A-arb3/5]
MNLDELRSVQSKERKKDSLQNLRPSFYQEVGDYIADLERERDRVAERADDPFSSPEVSRLTDEIETAKDVVEAIYERRMGKLVKQASLAAAGMSADDEGLTAEEADLFDDLVDRIGSNKARVLDVLEGVEDDAVGGDETTPSTASATDATTTPETDAATRSDTPPAPPQEPPAEGESDPGSEPRSELEPSDGEPSDASGVTPADVMGGGDSVPESGSGTETDSDRHAPEAGSPSGSDRDEDRAGEQNRPDGPAGIGTDSRASEPESGATDATESGSSDESDENDVDSDSDTDPDADVERVTVKITRDIGPILGVDDREYTLSTDDIVTLPEQNATPLVDREAAEPLE